MLAVHQWSDIGSQGVCYIPLGGASHLSCMYQANPGLWDQNVGGGGGGLPQTLWLFYLELPVNQRV